MSDDWRENNDEVAALLPQARQYEGKRSRMSCPFCASSGHRDRKLSLTVNMLTGKWRCYRCQLWGRISGYDDEDYDEDYNEDDKEDPNAFEVPAEFVPLTGNKSYTFRPAREYLRARGVPSSIWAKANIHACDEGFYAGRIIVPFLDPKDEKQWLGWIARLWVSKPKKSAWGAAAMPYLYPADMQKGFYFYNHNALFRETKRPVFVVEGAFDSFPYWPHVVACLGKPSFNQIDALYGAARPICVCLDGDAWEEAHMLSCQLQFDGLQAGCLRLPAGYDPATLPPDRLIEAAKKSIGRFEPVRV